MKECDRREALARLAALGAGAVGLGLCAGCPGGSTYSEQLEQEAAAAQVRTVVQKTQVQPLNAIKVTVAGKPAWLFRGSGNDDWRAFDARCTHRGCKLDFNAPGLEFVCPCHGSKFGVEGQVLTGPARMPLSAFEVVVSEDQVEVLPEKAAGGGLMG